MFVEQILSELTAANIHYFCAVEASNWQIASEDEATDEFQTDLAEMETSTILLALLEEDRSVGMQTEIGYYLKLLRDNPKKKIVLAHSHKTILSWTNRALCKFVGVNELAYNEPEEITDYLKSIR